MKKCQLFILLLFFVKSSFAQTSGFDELPLPVLRQKLSVSTNDTNTVKLQLALGHLMLLKATKGERDIDSAKKFADQAAVLSHRLNYDFGIINAILLSAETFYHRNDRETGLKIAQNALAFSKMHNNSDGEARSYHLIAQYYPTSDPVSLRSRISYINKAIAIFRKNRNNLWLSFLLTQNADMLTQAGRSTEGLKLLFEALNLGKGVSRRTVEGIYWNIGRISMAIGDYTNALKYDLLAVKTAKEVNDTTMQVVYIQHLIASTYIKAGDYDRAIPYSIKVLKMAKRYNETWCVKMASSALAFAYTHSNRLPQALGVLNELKSVASSDFDKLSVNVDFLNSLVFAKQFSQAGHYVKELKKLLPVIPPNNPAVIMDAYNALAYYYSETKQLKLALHYTDLYAALAHQLKYVEEITAADDRYYKLVKLDRRSRSDVGTFFKDQEIRDSAYNKVKAYQIFLLDMENETLEKNRHIDSLTMDAQIKEIKLKRNQLIQKVTICGSAMLLIITGLIYSRYRLKQHSNALLTLQKEEIDNKNNVLQQLIMDKNELLKDKDELISLKDLLFKEVNHRVKNNLQSVILLLENQAAILEGEAFDAVNISRHRIYAMSLVHEQLIESSKLKSVNMSLYLPQLIEHIKDSFQGPTQVNIRISVEELMIDVSLALPLALIVNEAVTNAFKYAFPNRKNGEVYVAFGMIKEQIRLEIADNGKGMDNQVKTKKNSGMGLNLMRGLCEDIDAKITFKNASGTRIVVVCDNDRRQEEINLDLALDHLPDLDMN
ncbi:histidine kinase dimerization/phosphoacceptor domain -containing protein [Mucilaginibacter sp. OK283]|uniref:tetratricopeptide repeat-containing sensor histidine kinase n=1 Tax=Mucilaginibacter sp. OK283 TaxID=1881049 RepID=UPI0008AEE9F0|nr:histidine kinase dimerization/phosphoacceptor domain -containing protein [Mucilaginibacter sp. OK283]SEO10145.1 Two-component sensor histidine kinase, contains HisKA and HATPase domains [Mucilaginibacter sp. OK283]